MRFYTLLVMQLFALFPTHTYAWWDDIQSAITQVAHPYLTPKAQQSIDKLLQFQITAPGSAELSQRTSDFINAGTWADRIKYVKWDYPESLSFYKKLHFINIKATPTTDPNVTYAKKIVADYLSANNTKHTNVVFGIQSMIKTLSSRTTSIHDKAIALRLLIDFAADIHQPLHCTNIYVFGESTRGENLIQLDPAIQLVTYNTTMPTKITELHALWDASGGRIKDVGRAYIIADSPYAKYLQEASQQMINSHRLNPELTQRVHDPELAHWVIDSYLIGLDATNTKRITYLPGPNNSHLVLGKLNNQEQYLRFVQQKSEEQIYLAGRHLALMLNAIFDPDQSSKEYLAYLQKTQNNPEVLTLNQLPPFK